MDMQRKKQIIKTRIGYNILLTNALANFILLGFCFLVLNFSMEAQAPPIFLPDDFDYEAEDAGCICSPGVINKSPGKGLLIEYKLTSGGSFTPDEVANGISSSNVNNLGRLRLRLKIPVIIKPKVKFLIGLDHFREQYTFNFIQPAFAEQLDLLANRTLKTSRVTGYFLQSIGETNYLGLQVRGAYSGNYDGIIDTDAYFRQIRVSAIWGVKKREDLEWGIGMIYSDNFARKRVLPFFLYNRTYNERWGLESAFPVSVLMRYNFTPTSLLLFGPEFTSAAYALRGEQQTPSDDYYFRHTELQFGAKYERQISPWIWTSIHGGLQINFDSRFEKVLNLDDLFEPDLITGAFLKIGLFLSPPN